MIIIQILIIIGLIIFFSSIFFVISKSGAKEGALEVFEKIKEVEKYFLLQQKYLENCSCIEKEYFRLEKNGVFQFVDESGNKRKAEFQKGINVIEHKI